jgi:type II secretory pathway pseudopilin PulG
MVSLAIIGTLLSMAVPYYDKKVLKGYFSEAKVTIQAISLAQERYKIETGDYYPIYGKTIQNEKLISKVLKVDLFSSRNFIYSITRPNANSQFKDSYIIKATLRNKDWGLCTNEDENSICKIKNPTYSDTHNMQKIETWVKNYKTGADKHYIRFRYPQPFVENNSTLKNVLNKIDYTHIYKGG